MAGRIRKGYWIFGICLCLVAAYGCSRSSAPPPNPVTQSPSSGQGPSSPPPQEFSGPRPQYLDFPDIPIPTELSLRSKDSYVFQSGQMKMGFLTLRGRVDPNSLMNFFIATLPREGWKLRGQFRYSRTVLIFEKAEKSCVMLIKEGNIYSYVEIYVAPAPDVKW
ncbi:MAG: hypothetical protein LLG06_11860 [Desulfobacteraceae bacterium]|nr:hypothetical protein [Desulfobacteraceae bacterium]